jgi:RimJ/RimL family protein N-acetyltransferase
MRLETPRLILRDWTEADIPELIEGLNDLNVSKWLAFVPHPYRREDAHRWIAHCQKIAVPDEIRINYEFAIELKSERKSIGGVSLIRIDREHGSAGGGIWLNRNYQGHGYGREAFGEKIRFAFEELKLQRLENGYFPGNDASAAMLRSIGYKAAGERRQAYRCLADGKLKDEWLMVLKQEEWIRGAS